MCALDKKCIFRIIDANFNRAKEGMRVCEDICRFLLNEKNITARYKDSRHKLSSIVSGLNGKRTKTDIILSRDMRKDVGKKSSIAEFKRENAYDVFYANSQRAKESIRVLEEFLKLLNKRCAQELKDLRYKIYILEKEIAKKL